MIVAEYAEDKEGIDVAPFLRVSQIEEGMCTEHGTKLIIKANV